MRRRVDDERSGEVDRVTLGANGRRPGAVDRRVRKRLLSEADVRRQHSQVLIRPANLRQRVHDLAAHAPELRRVARNAELGHVVHVPIEDARAGAIPERLVVSVEPHAVHDVRIAPRPLEEFRNERGRVHARQHDDDVVADRHVEPRGDRRFLAEVARQPEEAKKVVSLEKRPHARDRRFRRAVVHENDLVVRDEAAQHGDRLLDERLDRVGAIAFQRGDDRDQGVGGHRSGWDVELAARAAGRAPRAVRLRRRTRCRSSRPAP